MIMKMPNTGGDQVAEELKQLQVDGTTEDIDTTPRQSAKSTPNSRRRRGTGGDAAYKLEADESDSDDHLVTSRRSSKGKTKPSPRNGLSDDTATDKEIPSSAKNAKRHSSNEQRFSTPTKPISRKRKSGLVNSSPPSAEKSLASKKSRAKLSSIVADSHDAMPLNLMERSLESITASSTALREAKTPTSDVQDVDESEFQSDSGAMSIEPQSHSPSPGREPGMDISMEGSGQSPPTHQRTGRKKRSSSQASQNGSSTGHSSQVADAEPVLPGLVKKSPPRERKDSQKEYRPNGEDRADADEEQEDMEPSAERVQREAQISERERAGQARLAEREARRRTELKDLTPQEYKLFATIDHRGFEPFLPATWQLDFPYKVDTFFGDTPETTHINSVGFKDSNANFRAIRALSNLIKVGPTVRDRYIVMQRRPEPWISKQIQAYMDWADRDTEYGTVRKAPKILSLAFDDAAQGNDSDSVVKRLERRMRKTAREWRAWLEENPTGGQKVEEGSGDVDLIVEDQKDAGLEKEPVSSPTALAPKGKPRLSAMFQWAKSLLRRDSTSSTADDEKTRTDNASRLDRKSTAINVVYGIAISHLVVAILSYPLYGPNGESDDEEEDDEFDDDDDDDGNDNDNDNQSESTNLTTSQAHTHTDHETTETPSDLESSTSYGGRASTTSLRSRRQPTGQQQQRSRREERREERQEQQRRSRIIFYVDFAKASEDVWNSVAVAMAVCHCRDLRVGHSVAAAAVAVDQMDGTGSNGKDDNVEAKRS